jgi:SET domain-containing protein
MISSPNKVEIKISPGKGRGVFATDFIEAGEIIEVCPVLDLPTIPEFDDYLLNDYRFKFGKENFKYVLSLGYGCIYNHSDDNNASWRDRLDINSIEFYSLRSIKPGEEICTRYTPNPNDYFSDKPHIIKV